MSQQPEHEPLPQGWVPRVVNGALAAFLLAFLVPVFIHLSGLATTVQIMLVLISLPLLLVTGLCLASAIRPGSLGRAVRRRRAR